MNILSYQFLGNDVYSWLLFGAVFVVIFMGLLTTRRILHTRLKVWVKKTATDLDDFFISLIRETKGLFLAMVSLLCASHLVLSVTAQSSQIVLKVFVITFLIQAAIWGKDAIQFFLGRYVAKRRVVAGDDASLETTIGGVQFLVRMALYVFIGLLIVENLGFDVKTLIAGLGIGGIAVALAAQNILGDLFASISIVLDKPFVVGDMILVDGMQGSVEKIGLKTTRLRSITGEQIIVSNASLLNGKIRNFKRMFERRVVFSVGVVYQTAAEKIRRIPLLIQEIISRQELVRFDRAHFKGFGPSSLDFEVVYFVVSPAFDDYVGIENEINNQIFVAFEREQIEFAYPTQTVYLQKEGSV